MIGPCPDPALHPTPPDSPLFFLIGAAAAAASAYQRSPNARRPLYQHQQEPPAPEKNVERSTTEATNQVGDREWRGAMLSSALSRRNHPHTHTHTGTHNNYSNYYWFLLSSIQVGREGQTIRLLFSLSQRRALPMVFFRFCEPDLAFFRFVSHRVARGSPDDRWRCYSDALFRSIWSNCDVRRSICDARNTPSKRKTAKTRPPNTTTTTPTHTHTHNNQPPQPITLFVFFANVK